MVGTLRESLSAICLGTVELGLPYGFNRPDEPDIPPEKQGIDVVLRALEKGINLIDTAPGYGKAEEVVGLALKQWHDPVFLATKVTPQIGQDQKLAEQFEESLKKSMELLGRDHIDLLQIHNATAQDLANPELISTLVKLREKKLITQIGASVYGEEDALAAIRHAEIEAIQIAFNLLDQRFSASVLPEASERGVVVLCRSALLKGVLTNRRALLPEKLGELAKAAQRAEVWASTLGSDLTTAALRFCLSQKQISSVLVGVKSIEELDTALSAAKQPPMTDGERKLASSLAINDEKIIDPRFWGVS